MTLDGSGSHYANGSITKYEWDLNGDGTYETSTGTTSKITTSFPNPGTYTGTVSVNNSTGVVSFSAAAPAGQHTITIRATDNCGTTTDANITLEVIAPNTAPSITAATGLSRGQGSTASNSTIATVGDNESGAGAVTVSVTSANPSNGITVSNIVNTNGTITADIVANCSPVALAAVKGQVAADLHRTEPEAFAASLLIPEEPGRRVDFVEGVTSYVDKRPPAFRSLPPRGTSLEGWPPA